MDGWLAATVENEPNNQDRQQRQTSKPKLVSQIWLLPDGDVLLMLRSIYYLFSSLSASRRMICMYGELIQYIDVHRTFILLKLKMNHRIWLNTWINKQTDICQLRSLQFFQIEFN